MCGLAGFLEAARALPSEELHAIVGRMAGTVRHRGPDAGGAWVDPSAGVAFGFRRLAILDLSEGGSQPMVSACGRYVTVFNGEIYNFRALRARLEAAGHVFRGHSDTEVMLAAFTAWGVEAALPRLNGMFAFAVWDRAARVLRLARDRVGEKPLYYGWAGRSFLFGSELKVLRAHPAFRAEIDRSALALYLRHKYVPAPFSIYAGVRKLPPGTLLTLALDAPGQLPEPRPYWSAREVAETGPDRWRDAGEATDALDELLRDAVRLRMEADVPLGAFLSGGIDSSTVVALMQAQSSRPVRTFTVGYQDEAFNEAADASAVARHLGTDHTELYVTPQDCIAVIDRLPALYDEPFADSSQIAVLLVSELARRHVTVSLSGDGGDELFGGYNRYLWVPTLLRRTGRLPRSLRRGAAALLTARSPQDWERLLRRVGAVAPWANHRLAGDKLYKLAAALGLGGVEEIYADLVTHWKQPTSLVPGSRDVPTPVTDRTKWARLPGPAEQMMFLDLVTYLPDDILTKLDRASMSVSLEARVPLLDHRVVELAWRVPPDMKVRNGTTKWLLRQVLYRYVPPHLVERPKMGFGVPIDRWLRGPLRDWAEALLDQDRLLADGYLDPGPIRARWGEHLAGRRDWQYHLWDVLMFQTWLNEVSRPAAGGADPVRGRQPTHLATESA